MPETNSKGQREMFIELYRVYQRYHYEKDWLVWVAATAYLGFVGIAVQWLTDNFCKRAEYKCLLGTTSLVICGIMAAFVWLQNKYKAVAVAVTYKLDALIKDFDKTGEATFASIRNAIKNPCIHPWRDSKAGCLLFALVTLLGVFQILLIAFYRPS